MSTTTYRIWHTACRIPYTRSGGASSGGSGSSGGSSGSSGSGSGSGSGQVVVVVVVLVVGIPRATYLMLHVRSRTLHVHDHISHMAHCMPHTIY